MAMKNLKDSPDFTEELVELRIKGKEPRGLGMYGYAAVKLWSQLVEKAKATDFDKVSKVISDTIRWSETCGTAFYKIVWNEDMFYI
jgi:hypothetical protein